MNKITPEMINLAAMYLNHTNNKPKRIKVTSEFAEQLEDLCQYKCASTLPEGIIANFVGIPVVVDDTIENEYELEF